MEVGGASEVFFHQQQLEKSPHYLESVGEILNLTDLSEVKFTTVKKNIVTYFFVSQLTGLIQNKTI